ncbi:MAG: hypothetical protein MUF64_01930 [Polyangiaceae bacterium]|nr:hypothetical protein [Polyangiaceae bacterium]
MSSRLSALLLAALLLSPRLASATCGTSCQGDLIDATCTPLAKDDQGAQPLQSGQPALLAVRCSTKCCAPGGPCSDSPDPIEASALSLRIADQPVDTTFTPQSSPACEGSQVFSFTLIREAGATGQLLAQEPKSPGNVILTSFIVEPGPGAGGASGSSGQSGAGGGSGSSGQGGAGGSSGSSGQSGAGGSTSPTDQEADGGCSWGGSPGGGGWALALGLAWLRLRRRR